MAALLCGGLLLMASCVLDPMPRDGGGGGGDDDATKVVRPTVTLRTTLGPIVIELFDTQAPENVALFLELIQSDFYQNTAFHVANDFFLAGGLFEPTGQAKDSEQSAPNESNSGLLNLRGRVAIIDPNANEEIAGLVGELGSGAGFIINVDDNAEFDFELVNGENGLTVIGRVISGMNVVDSISEIENIQQQVVRVTQTFVNAAGTEPEPSPEPNDPPVADAGEDFTVTVNTEGQLDATASSDPNEDTLNFTWSQLSGAIVELSDIGVADPTFTPEETGTYEFQVTVSDGKTGVATDTVTVTVGSAPVADAGEDRIVRAGEEVTLDGSNSSDPDEDELTVSWQQTGGPNVELDDPEGFTTLFTAPDTDSEVILTFEFTVDDGFGGVETDSVNITVVPNELPDADAGDDDLVRPGDAVTLDGSESSDPDEDELTFSWTQIQGESVDLNDADTNAPSFTAPETDNELILSFELTVEDAFGGSDTDTVQITVVPNDAPIAEAGEDQNVKPGDAVTLDGSDSEDPDGGTNLTYSWSLTAESQAALDDAGLSVNLQGQDQPIATFTAPDAEDTLRLTFELAVEDEDGDTSSDTTAVTIRPNDAPTAEAGPDQTALAGETVTLDGSASSDPDEGDALTHEWALTPASQVTLDNAGVSITLSDTISVRPQFVAPDVDQTLAVAFELTVTDEKGLTDTDTVTITIQPGDPEFTTTGSGLQWRDVDEGDGDVVQPDSTLRVNYVGRLDDENGDEFDSSTDPDNPAEFNLQGLIEGWKEGLGEIEMREGGTRQLIIPPDLGYGDQERPGIPANSTLWFEITVFEIVE